MIKFSTFLNGLFLMLIVGLAACYPPYLDDEKSNTGQNQLTAPASFYININPFCCASRGLDSADVVNDAIRRYGRIVKITLLPNADVVNGKEVQFQLNLLDNTEEIDVGQGGHRYDNCDKLTSHSMSLALGEWTISYTELDELQRPQTRTQRITVQTTTPHLNCFRIF